MELPPDIVSFFEKQTFVLVSTIDQQGKINVSAKGILEMKPAGEVFLLDLYHGNTFRNLTKNPAVSLTAICEKHFTGYTLQGKARIVKRGNFDATIISRWYHKISRRISNRLIKNLQEGRNALVHPEAMLPEPKYLVVVRVSKVIDLAPAHLKGTPK